MHMRTTLDLPQNLLKEAVTQLGVKTKTEAIIMALTESIQRRNSRHIMKLRGSMTEDYDYKATRRKR
jgi:Arc/MetJ family transcription regulator